MLSRTRRDDAEDATLRLVQEHAGQLLRFARRFSYCADDAHDAYQRALEILVRRMRSDPPSEPLRWLRTVLRHEALAVRAEREQLLGGVELDLDRHEDRALPDPSDRAISHERLRHTAEALRRLKPQEVTALVLRAEGLTYAEICTRMGWTYTKTNRCVTEGRRALLERLGAIESGAECARWLPLLSALADGEASAAELAELRPHLRACPACRAVLRDVHAAPSQVALLVPPAVVEAAAAAAGGGLTGHAELGLHALVERMTLLAARAQSALEALPGTKLAAVAASSAAIAGGGVALEQATHGGAGREPDRAAQAVAAPAGGVAGLVPAPFSSRAGGSAAAGSRREQRRSTAPRGEFARSSLAPSEFTPRAAPRAEFASGGVAPPAASAASSPPAPGPGAEFAAP